MRQFSWYGPTPPGRKKKYQSISPLHPRHIGLIAVLVILCGCETIPPSPQVVHVPISTSCLPANLPQRPAIATEAELAALDDYRFTLEIFIDRRSLLNYSSELEAVLSACK